MFAKKNKLMEKLKSKVRQITKLESVNLSTMNAQGIKNSGIN